MPIYEYHCKSCEAKFEKLVRSMSAADDGIKCPECGSDKTARALSVFAVAAEGSAKTAGASDAGPMCGRCGGPGPCAMD
jgi:putative FmdB family regulatory protein